MKIKPWLILLLINIVVLFFPIDYRFIISGQNTHNIIPMIFAFIFTAITGNGIIIWYLAIVLGLNILVVFFFKWRRKLYRIPR